MPGICERLQPLLGPETAVVTASNGIPWWYFHKLEGPYEGRRIAAVDPGGTQWDLIGPERAIGCVIFAAGEIVEPASSKSPLISARSACLRRARTGRVASACRR